LESTRRLLNFVPKSEADVFCFADSQVVVLVQIRHREVLAAVQVQDGGGFMEIKAYVNCHIYRLHVKMA
jgi:hypothetical protein